MWWLETRLGGLSSDVAPAPPTGLAQELAFAVRQEASITRASRPITCGTTAQLLEELAAPPNVGEMP